MDEALFPPFGEKSRSRIEVKEEVCKFLCDKVLHCSNEDLPDEAVILVSGKWALIARLFMLNIMNQVSHGSQDSETDIHEQQQQLERCLQHEAYNFRNHPTHLNLSENDSETLASFIEEQSGIKDFEKR